MKRVKSVVAGIALGAMLALSGAVAFASGSIAEPRYNVWDCPSCGKGNMTEQTTTEAHHADTVNCTHYPYGFDLYIVYQETVRQVCDSCGYSELDRVSYVNGPVECYGYN